MRWYCVVFTLIHVLSYGLPYGKTQGPEVQVGLVFETNIVGIGTSVAWHPSGAYFVVGIDSTLYFFNPIKGESFREIMLPAQVSQAAIAGLTWSPDGTRLAILWGGDWEKIQYEVWILDTATSEVALVIGAEAIRSIHWSPNGLFLAGIQIHLIGVEHGPEESTFVIWDSQTGEVTSQYRPEEYEPPHTDDKEDGPAAIVWMTDSQLITISYMAKLAIIDLESNEITLLEEQPVRRGEYQVGDLGHGFDYSGTSQLTDWQAENNLFAFGASRSGEINIWDLQQGQLSGQLLGHTGSIIALEWHPTEDLLASGSLDETLRVWDTTTYLEIVNLPHDGAVASLAWDSEGTYLASISENGTVYLWQISLQD